MTPMDASFRDLAFANPDIRTSFHRRMELVVSEDLVDDAYYFIQNIEPLLKDEQIFLPTDTELAVFYERLVVRARFVILSQLSDDEVVGLLERYYTDHFVLKTLGYDLYRKIRAKILTLDLTTRDGFKIRLRQALEENQQFLTNDFLVIQAGSEKPTVASWLRDFRVFTADREVNALLVNEYFSRSPNVQKLSQGDRDKIRDLVTLYERLNKSSLTFEGIEDRVIYTDDRGDTYLLSEGQIERMHFGNSPIVRDAQGNLTVRTKANASNSVVSPVVSSSADVSGVSQPVSADNPYQRLRHVYADHLRDQAAIEVLEQQVFSESGGNRRNLENDILRSLEMGDVARTLAGLFLLAKGGLLFELVRGNKQFINMLEPYLVKNFSSGVAKSFRETPHNPAFLNALIHVLLRAKLKLDENTSAIVALQLGEIAFSTGSFHAYGMTYGNPQKGRFEWHQFDTSDPNRLQVSPWQIVSIRGKMAEMSIENKWKLMSASVLVSEDRHGRPKQLHEVGRDILARLTPRDVEACDKQASTDFRQSIGAEDVLRQIEDFAGRVENGAVSGVAPEQGRVIRDFVDLLRV